MPTLYQSDVVLNRKPARLEAGPCIVSMRSLFPVRAAFAAGDIIESLVLPADHVIVDALIDADDLDGATALVYDVGLMSGAVGLKNINRSVGAQLFSGATTGQAAGIARATARTAFSILPAPVDRSIGIKITTKPGTDLTLTAQADAVTNRGIWQPNTAYALKDFVALPDGRRVRVTTAGTSGAAMPLEAFGAAVFGGTVTDGGVTWTMTDPYLALSVSYRSAAGGL